MLFPMPIYFDNQKIKTGKPCRKSPKYKLFFAYKKAEQTGFLCKVEKSNKTEACTSYFWCFLQNSWSPDVKNHFWIIQKLSIFALYYFYPFKNKYALPGVYY